MTDKQTKSRRLRFVSGESNKVYVATLEYNPIVNGKKTATAKFEWGRYGASLLQQQIVGPLPEWEAEAEWSRRINEKLDKGYKYDDVGQTIKPIVQPGVFLTKEDLAFHADTVTIENFVCDFGVRNKYKVPMLRVNVAPSLDRYAEKNGVYHFSHDQGPVFISYQYTASQPTPKPSKGPTLKDQPKPHQKDRVTATPPQPKPAPMPTYQPGKRKFRLDD